APGAGPSAGPSPPREGGRPRARGRGGPASGACSPAVSFHRRRKRRYLERLSASNWALARLALLAAGGGRRSEAQRHPLLFLPSDMALTDHGLLARRVGVPASTLRAWEADRGMPGLPVSLRLAEALGGPTARLAG